jgi:hypothetical protein
LRVSKAEADVAGDSQSFRAKMSPNCTVRRSL